MEKRGEALSIKMVERQRDHSLGSRSAWIGLPLAAVFLMLGCTDSPQSRGCITEQDCAPSEVCRGGECTSRARCSSDFDCPQTELCLNGTCELIQCLGEETCGDGRRCVNGWCVRREVSGCLRDEDCPSGTCSLSQGICEPDRNEDAGGCVDDCPDSMSDGCDASDDCPLGMYCTAGVCAPGCRNDDQCPGELCQVTTGQCQARSCLRNTDCAEGRVCTARLRDDAQLELQCRLSGVPLRRECLQDADCQTGACLVDQTCLEACLNDQDCGGRLCTQNEWRPEDGAQVALLSCRRPAMDCQADIDCPPDQVCLPVLNEDDVSLRCTITPVGSSAGARCTESGACQSQTCLNGRCWSPCAPGNIQHCGDGLRCYENGHYLRDQGEQPGGDDDEFFGLGACLPDRGSGHPCVDRQCPDGEVCTLSPGPRRREWSNICRRAVGALRGGAECMGDTQCRSGWCGPESFCLDPCRNGMPTTSCVEDAVCESVRLPLWKGDSMTPAWTARSEVCR